MLLETSTRLPGKRTYSANFASALREANPAAATPRRTTPARPVRSTAAGPATTCSVRHYEKDDVTGAVRIGEPILLPVPGLTGLPITQRWFDLAPTRLLPRDQRARSRSRFDPVRLATIRAPLFITTSTRAASYGSMDATYSRFMRCDRWILKKFAARKCRSRSDNRILTRYSFAAVKIVT